jgi:hypothetical protein
MGNLEEQHIQLIRYKENGKGGSNWSESKGRKLKSRIGN